MEEMEEHEEVSADPFAELWQHEESHSQQVIGTQWGPSSSSNNTGIPKSAAVERLFSTAGGRPEAKEGVPHEDAQLEGPPMNMRKRAIGHHVRHEGAHCVRIAPPEWRLGNGAYFRAR
ncbi:hypothetical protein GWK47_008170 [Chionoecetes opilio]|uniref:Uncharacterized protein n=1 Tax=Chionoecetes opilio TaxID=41210 RepID=A0A8J4Y015_CHIOP|nr:hypothetical protein GWK47_008170 [Chionoecetes opilio]